MEAKDRQAAMNENKKCWGVQDLDKKGNRTRRRKKEMGALSKQRG